MSERVTIEQEVDQYVDNLAAEIYKVRSLSSREMTPERWARVKEEFPGSARVCLAEAKQAYAKEINEFRNYLRRNASGS